MEITKFAHQEMNLPQNLKEARQNVLKLPGIEHYLPDTDISEAEIEEELERMVSEVTKQLDAENMIDFITFSLALSGGEREQFFSNPERQQFQSKIGLSEDSKERMQQFFAIGTYLALKYKDTRKRKGVDNEESKSAAQSLRMFHEYSTYHLFGQLAYGFSDKVNGIEGRDEGAKLSSEILELFQDSARQVSSESNSDRSALHRQVLESTEGGNYAASFSYLLNNQGNTHLRRALEVAMEKRTDDQDLMSEKLRLLWQIEIYRMSMGIDLELLYEINQLPEGDVIEAKLHQFLSKEELVDEMREHLKREAFPAMAQADRDRPIDYWQMLAERAKYHKLSDKASTVDELERKKKRVWRELSEFLPPVSFEDTPTSYIGAPTRIGASLRAYNITYPNHENGLVNVVVLNPRDTEILFAEITGHEIGHKLHAYFVRAAEDKRYVPKEGWERLPSAVKEEFSQLLEDQVGKILRRKRGVSEPEIKETAGERREWRDLWNAFLARRQAPYALTQKAVRLEMESMFKQGKRDWILSDEEAAQIIEDLEPQLKGWYAEGVPLRAANQTTLTNVNLLEPLDGLVYLLKYVKEEEEEKPKGPRRTEIIGIREAFEKRFGEIWLDNSDAKAVLFALMVETGRNHDLTTYGDFVLTADIEGVKSQLASWTPTITPQTSL